MATTVSAIQTKVNSIIRDTSTNSVTAAERLSAISIAVQDTITALSLPMQDQSYPFNFYDGIGKYVVTSAMADYMDSVDLVREDGDQIQFFTKLTPREIYVDIDSGWGTEPSFAVERLDSALYLIVNADAKYGAIQVHDCDSITNNGTWEADTTTSDAENIATDTVVFRQGSGSVKFDADVSNSANNRATISNSTFQEIDLEHLEGISSMLFDFYLPESTNFSSVTAYWGSDSSNYHSGTVTTDINGASFRETAWNTCKVDWSSATTTGTPDSSAIDYLRFDFNYAGGYSDASGFRLDNVRFARPETLTIKYQSNYVGTNSSGTGLFAFTSTTDIPFYSGQYDYLDNAVARRAAQILLEACGEYDEAQVQEARWLSGLADARKRFPSTRLVERSSFKVGGLSSRRRGRSRIVIR